jgi:hypothetical protein
MNAVHYFRQACSLGNVSQDSYSCGSNLVQEKAALLGSLTHACNPNYLGG